MSDSEEVRITLGVSLERTLHLIIQPDGWWHLVLIQGDHDGHVDRKDICISPAERRKLTDALHGVACFTLVPQEKEDA